MAYERGLVDLDKRGCKGIVTDIVCGLVSPANPIPHRVSNYKPILREIGQFLHIDYFLFVVLVDLKFCGLFLSEAPPGPPTKL